MKCKALVQLHFTLLLWVAGLVALAAESRLLRVVPDAQGAAQVITAGGRRATVTKEADQTGIDSIQISEDGQTAGWLVEFHDPGVSYPIAGKLVIWRSGRIVQRFTPVQSFYSWAFQAQAKQVAYHFGPLHGEQSSHCELHDIKTGRRLAQWDGDLDADKRPAWTQNLHH